MLNLIIIEDDETTRQGLCSLFPWEEIQIYVSASFDDALKAWDYIRSHEVDIILTDIRLTNSTGFDLAEKIVENNLDIKLVFITAYKDFDYVQQALRLKAQDFLLKPIKYNELMACMLKIRDEQFNTSPDQPPVSADTKYYERIVTTVKKYIADNLKDADLVSAAILVNLSAGYLSRLFKEKTAQTFTDYLMTVRMQKAADYLLTTNLKTYEISDYLGYDNPKNFTRAFKNHFGIPPKSYKENGGVTK